MAFITSANKSPSMPSTVLPDQAPVGVPGEPFVAEHRGQAADRHVVETDVEVSIIPGIENFAPDRTDTRSGSLDEESGCGSVEPSTHRRGGCRVSSPAVSPAHLLR
jgi:hypothetical protein